MKTTNLVIAGCSFVEPHDSFAYKLQELYPHLDSQVHGMAAAGPKLVGRTTLCHLSDLINNNKKPALLFQISTLDRHEILFHRDDLSNYDEILNHDKTNHLAFPMWTKSGQRIPRDESDSMSDINSDFNPNNMLWLKSGSQNPNWRSLKWLQEFWENYYARYWTVEHGIIESLEIILLVQFFCKTNNIPYLMVTIYDCFSMIEHMKTEWPMAYRLFKMLDLNCFNFYTEYQLRSPDDIENNYIEWTTRSKSKHRWDMFPYNEKEIGTRFKYGGISEWILHNGYLYDGHPDSKGHLAYAKYIKPHLDKIL